MFLVGFNWAMGHRLLGTTDLSHYLQHNPRLIAGIPLGWWMPGGVGAGVAEPDWRPPGWRGLTGLNEPSYNGGGEQRAGRPGTTDQSLYSTLARQSERDSPCFSGVFWGDLWLHFWDSCSLKSTKTPIDHFYRGKVLNLLRRIRKK